MSRVKIIIGGAVLSRGSEYQEPAIFQATVELLNARDIKDIDSAKIYEGCESFIGNSELGMKGFRIDTKTPGGWEPGSSTREGVFQNLIESLEKLQVEKAHIYYIHAPDESVALEDTLAGINDAYEKGLFDRFGLSNFPPNEVELVYRLAKEKRYVLPTVYQGCYSPVTRKAEKVLFPILRKLGISFYAYSPLAGGLLTKTKEQILNGIGRFDRTHQFGKMYERMYFKPAYLESLASWATIANEEGISTAELAYRYVAYNSILEPRYGDSLIIGPRTLEQLRQAIEGIERGPLSEKAQHSIDALWKKVEHEALLDNFEAAHLTSSN